MAKRFTALRSWARIQQLYNICMEFVHWRVGFLPHSYIWCRSQNVSFWSIPQTQCEQNLIELQLCYKQQVLRLFRPLSQLHNFIHLQHRKIKTATPGNSVLVYTRPSSFLSVSALQHHRLTSTKEAAFSSTLQHKGLDRVPPCTSDHPHTIEVVLEQQSWHPSQHYFARVTRRCIQA